MAAEPTPETVVLLHGLWCNHWVLHYLRRRLRQCGFRVVLFEYPTVRRSPRENAASLAAHIREWQLPRVHVVGHSLGGIVLLHLFEDCTDLPPGRTVLLGSPLQGSRMARRLTGSAAGRWLLGRSIDGGLLGGPPCHPRREIGMIAGTLPVGLGVLVGGVGAPGDGAVALAETREPWLADHIAVRTSHTGLLFSPEVARQTCEFLRRGRFSRA